MHFLLLFLICLLLQEYSLWPSWRLKKDIAAFHSKLLLRQWKKKMEVSFKTIGRVNSLMNMLPHVQRERAGVAMLILKSPVPCRPSQHNQSFTNKLYAFSWFPSVGQLHICRRHFRYSNTLKLCKFLYDSLHVFSVF